MIDQTDRASAYGLRASSSTAPGVPHDNNVGSERQRPLPLPWRRAPEAGDTCFAHPAERELARILTFHRVRWVYEPTTFVLEQDEVGTPTICFNPDFYLPDHNRYLELTTMRQTHVTRKNRKMRLLRERYPSIDARLLYRKDFDRLVLRCRSEADPDGLAAGRVLFGGDAVAGRVMEVAGELMRDGGPDVVVTVGRGADRFAAEVTAAVRQRGAAPSTGRMALAGGDATSSARRLHVHRGPGVPVERRRVLIATGVVSTGLTVDFAARWLRARGASRVEVVTLLDRHAARIVTPDIRAAGFVVGDEVAAGYGLTIGGRLGELPDIVEVERVGPLEPWSGLLGA